MLLGAEVGLGLGDVVLDGEPAPPKKGHSPNFWTMSIAAKRRPFSATRPIIYYMKLFHYC